MKKFFLASILSAFLPTVATANDITVEKFQDVIRDKNTIILDVRTVEEFNAEHLEGAINIDFYGKNFENEILKLDKNKRYAIYCRSGNRSGKAMNLLKRNGYKDVFNLIGGLSSSGNRKALNLK